MSNLEQILIEKFTVPKPHETPIVVFQRLSAFWQHFSLHRRRCHLSGEDIISVFGDDCPYPVWKRSLWNESSNPPTSIYREAPFFEQLWDLFQLCPIPHMTGLGSENCDYCDDWWNSKNCYLCHCGLACVDCLQCYRCLGCHDCRAAVFAFDCQLCIEVVQAHRSFNVRYASHVWQCRDSAFLFDCRNSSDCFMCWNLRNARFCIGNQQYSEDEYRRLRTQYDLSSYSVVQKVARDFNALIMSHAWWKALDRERCNNATGCYIEQLNNCEECYFLSESEHSFNCVRGNRLKDCFNTVGCWNSELLYQTVLVGDKRSYNLKNCYHISDSSHLEYCGFCVRCQNCFACCGLIGKQFHILNRPYAEAEYYRLVSVIKSHLERQNLNGCFFPGYFSPCPYEESLAGVHLPLTRSQVTALGFRASSQIETRNSATASTTIIPERADDLEEDLFQQTFYDQESERRFSISKSEVKFAQRHQAPLLREHYFTTLRRLFGTLAFNGEMRQQRCAKSGEEIVTNLPEVLSSRIISERAYLELF